MKYDLQVSQSRREHLRYIAVEVVLAKVAAGKHNTHQKKWLHVVTFEGLNHVADKRQGSQAILIKNRKKTQ
jgi:hypothetical protein